MSPCVHTPGDASGEGSLIFRTVVLPSSLCGDSQLLVLGVDFARRAVTHPGWRRSVGVSGLMGLQELGQDRELVAGADRAHEALNWGRATAKAQAEHPDEIVVFAPHAACIMIFDADEDPEYIRDSITPIPAAEVDLSNELLQRRNALMRDHSKAQLVAMILRRWRVPRADPARWTKQELANYLVDSEDSRERYEAYGRVALINGRPTRDSRPLCGGVGCSGHDSMTPWPETRARFRAQGPCIDAQ